MSKPIDQSHVLILATDGFEYSELTRPRDTLLERGARVTLASPRLDPIAGESGGDPKGTVTPDIVLADADPDNYDALLLPGGQRNPDSLRIEEDAVRLVKAFDEARKPIAAICHGPWLLVEADIVDGRTVTGWPSIRTDLDNAGATVVDEEVVVDDYIVTSRKPDDIPAFTEALIRAIEGAKVAEAA